MAVPVLGWALTALSKLASEKNANAITDLNASSLVEFTQAAQVEPIVAVDTRLVGYDITTDICKMLNSRFTGYYLAAGSMLGDTGRIKTVKALDKINPNRSPGYALASNILSTVGVSAVGNCDIDGTSDIPLGNPDEVNAIIDEVQAPDDDFKLPTYSAESSSLIKENEEIKKKMSQLNANKNAQDDSNVTFGRMSAAGNLRDVENLSVGHMVTLTISDGEASREVPVTIRLLSYPTDPRTLKTILQWTDKDNSFKARLSAWRAGEITFWRDLVLMRDVMVERRNALMKDRTGIYRALTSRQNKNMLAGVLSMSPSVGTISSMLVVASDTIEEAEEGMDNRFSNYNARTRFMNSTGVMFLCVVDVVSELVTVYTYTQARADEYSFKQVKAASKSGGDNITDIIKLLNPQTQAF